MATNKGPGRPLEGSTIDLNGWGSTWVAIYEFKTLVERLKRFVVPHKS